MADSMRMFLSGPDHSEISLPDWFKERADALIKNLGDSQPDSRVFKDILDQGYLNPEFLQRVDQLAAKTSHPDIFLLAVDIGTHGFTVLQSISQLVPLRPKAA